MISIDFSNFSIIEMIFIVVSGSFIGALVLFKYMFLPIIKWINN